MSGVSAFLWQAALMLLVAYFLGAWIGCLLRRLLTRPPKVVMEADNVRQRHINTAGVATASVAGTAAVNDATERFGRALDGDRRSASSPSGAMGDAAARSAQSRSHTEDPSPPPSDKPTEAPPTTTAQAATAAAAAIALAAREQNASSVNDEQIPPTQATLQEPASNLSVADRMEQLGPAPDQPSQNTVDAPADTPPSQTGQSSSDDDALSTMAPDTNASQNNTENLAPSLAAGTLAAAGAVIASAPSAAADNLTKINGITDEDATKLNDLGVKTFAVLAQWSNADLAKHAGRLGGRTRIARENWIEQAALLALTGKTTFSQRTTAPLAIWDNDGQSAGATEKPSPTSNRPDVAGRAAFARPVRRYYDDLQQIDGINAEVEQLLNERGIVRINQIADWDEREVQRFDHLLGGMDRVRRERWIEQATKLTGQKSRTPQSVITEKHDQRASDTPASSDTNGPGVGAPNRESDQASNTAKGSGPAAVATTPDNAAAPTETRDVPNETASNVTQFPDNHREDVRGLRSVRSEALVGVPTIGNVDGSGDDLKRIRGIGVLIEKRLRAMGYSHYEQIGGWSQAEVDKVNQKLDFRGRIERENWIQQARILAAGGQTEFSRRQERDD